ncbi:hypothetical protein RhiirC2_802931, partial [Rhizophagus irregularis]
MKNAYIYVDEKNFLENASGAISTNFNRSSIYIYPSTVTSKTCNICGTCNHATNNCDDKNFTLDRNNRKIFTKRLIKRNDKKITIDDKYKTTYNHVIALNTNRTQNNKTNTQQQNTRPVQSRQQYRPPQLQNNYNPHTSYNASPNLQRQNTQRTQYNTNQNNKDLIERIKQLENQ